MRKSLYWREALVALSERGLWTYGAKLQFSFTPQWVFSAMQWFSLQRDVYSVHRTGGRESLVASVALMPRSLLVFCSDAYHSCLHGIDEVCASGFRIKNKMAYLMYLDNWILYNFVIGALRLPYGPTPLSFSLWQH